MIALHPHSNLRWLPLCTFLVLISLARIGQCGEATPSQLARRTLQPSEYEASPATLPAECRTDFWVVSSHRCRQSCRTNCVAAELDYLHADSSGCLTRWDESTFHQWLHPGAPVCILVHGSFVDADFLARGLFGQSQELVDDNARTVQWIRSAAPERPINMVFYSWPSDSPVTYLPLVDVGLLGRRSSFNGIYLADFISRIPPGHPISLVGHSHGARMAASTLHLLAGGEVQGHRLCRPAANNARIRTVLMAAAMDHHWLVPGQRFGHALCRAEAILNVKNEHDIALNVYPLRRPFSHRALGEAGVTRRDRRALGGFNTRLVEMDVTHLIQTGHLWHNFLHRPEIAHALRHYFFFDDLDAEATQPDQQAGAQSERTNTPIDLSFSNRGEPISSSAVDRQRPAEKSKVPHHGSSESVHQVSGKRS